MSKSETLLFVCDRYPQKVTPHGSSCLDGSSNDNVLNVRHFQGGPMVSSVYKSSLFFVCLTLMSILGTRGHAVTNFDGVALSDSVINASVRMNHNICQSGECTPAVTAVECTTNEMLITCATTIPYQDPQSEEVKNYKFEDTAQVRTNGTFRLHKTAPISCAIVGGVRICNERISFEMSAQLIPTEESSNLVVTGFSVGLLQWVRYNTGGLPHYEWVYFPKYSMAK